MINRFFLKFKINNIFQKKNIKKTISNYYSSNNFLYYSYGRSCLYHVLKKEITKEKNVIITSPLTLPAIIDTIKLAGAKIKFVDIDIETGLPNLEKLRNKITNRTNSILITHLYSNKKKLKEISKLKDRYKKINIIEDLAINFGIKGSGKRFTTLNADYSFFSFNFMKNFHTILGGALYVKNNKDFKDLKFKQLNFIGFDKVLLVKTIIKFVVIKIFSNKYLFSLFLYNLIKVIEIKNINFLKKFLYPGFYAGELNKKKFYYKINEIGKIFFPNKTIEIKNDLTLRKKKSLLYYKNLYQNKNIVLFNPDETESINLEYLLIVKKDFKKLYKFLLDKNIYLRQYWYKNNFKKMRNSEFLSKNSLLLPTHESIKEVNVIFISKIINKFYEINN
jgi:dTDP-4-amino-4,6-dideoxygalactose transaminase